MHGVQHIGVVADPAGFGNTMQAKLAAMDAAAKLYATERTKENPDKARANELYGALITTALLIDYIMTLGRPKGQTPCRSPLGRMVTNFWPRLPG